VEGGYLDHIIVHDRGLQKIREYVLTNPMRWHEDTFDLRSCHTEREFRVTKIARLPPTTPHSISRRAG
jgi:hypothetical protein